MTKGLQASVLALTLPPFKVTEYFPPGWTSVSPHAFIHSFPPNKLLEHQACDKTIRTIDLGYSSELRKDSSSLRKGE